MLNGQMRPPPPRPHPFRRLLVASRRLGRQAIAVTSTDPILLEWRLKTSAPPERAWSSLSDTDRFSEALGSDVVWEEMARPDGSVQRLGKVRLAGAVLDFEELAFDFEAPRRLRIDRAFDAGPLARRVAELDLEPMEEGTAVRYRLVAWPRSQAVRPLVEETHRDRVFPVVDGVLRGLLAQLEGSGPGPDLSAPPLEPAALRTLERGCAALDPPVFGEALRRFLAAAPLREQDRMEPRRLAAAWGLDEEAALDGFLAAVRVGLLVLTWDMLCPSCRAPKHRRPELPLTGADVHCASCNLDYDGASPDSLRVSFRPAPALRSFHVEVRCVGSPAHTPHVVARADLEPGEERTWELDLPRGGYRLRSLSSLDSASLEVAAGVAATRATVDVGDAGVYPSVLRLSPGPVRIHVRARRGAPTRVVLENRWDGDAALTLGRLLERTRGRDLLPDDVSALLAHRRGAVLVSEAFGQRRAVLHLLRELVARRAPATLQTGDRTLVATWDEFAAAADVASHLQGALGVCSAVGFGGLVRLRAGDATHASGRAVEETMEALRVSLPGRTSLAGSATAEEQVARFVGGGQIRLVHAPGVGDRADWLLDFADPPGPPPGLAGLVPAGPVDAALVGRTLDRRYALEEVLGRGGFGVVFAAEDRRTGDSVVLKVLGTERASDPALLQNLFDEARACARLRHPNTVRMLDYGHTETGWPYLVLERLRGGTLHDAMAASGLLGPGRMCRIAGDVLGSLEEAHAAGVVHRDLKPPNIFLVRDEAGREQAKVLDFGIAWDRLAGGDPREIGRLVGTPEYMSPEQVLGETIDGRSDLYAVGLVLYRCLAGRLPFSREPGLGPAFKRVTEGLPPLGPTAFQRLDEGLVAVVERALARHPDDRYADAAEMRRALEALGELRFEPAEEERQAALRHRIDALAATAVQGDAG